MTTNQRGQGAIEAVIALPLLVALLGGFAAVIARGLLRMELQTLVQELNVCHASTHSKPYCRQHFEVSLRQLPGGFRVVRISGNPQLTVFLAHELPLPPRQWQIRVPHR